MQTQEQIFKTIKVVAICVVVFIGVIVIYHFFLNGHKPSGKTEVEEHIDFTYQEPNAEYQNPTYCGNDIYRVEYQDKIRLITADLAVLEEQTGKDSLYCLFDGYYLVKTNDKYTLYKNNSIVKGNLDFNNPQNYLHEIYTDEASANNKYVSYLYLYNLVQGKNNNQWENIIYSENNENGLLYDYTSGKIIDQNVKHIRDIEVAGVTGSYLYIEGLSNYIWDLKNSQKRLENINIIWDEITDTTVKIKTINNLVYKNGNLSGIIDLKGNIILRPENQEIKLSSDNTTYYALKKNGKYGLINSSGNMAFDYSYDNAIVLDDFILMVKDKTLTIYDSLLKKVGDKDYPVEDNNLVVTKFSGFYRIQNVKDSGTKELVLTQDKKIYTIKGIMEIANGEYFYGTPCYYINDDGNFYIYIDANNQKSIQANYKDNVSHVILLNDNRLYVDLPREDKWQYTFYRVNTGDVLHSYVKEAVDVEFEVIKNNEFIFSRENDKIDIIYHNILQKEIAAQKIVPLNDDFYAIQLKDHNAFVKISY